MTDVEWGEFLRWAEIVGQNVDLNEAEHNYKREVARELAAARQLFLENDTGWAGRLVKVLKSNNLINWHAVNQVAEAAKDRAELLADAVTILWGDHEVGAADLEAFDTPVKAAVHGTSPGNIVALGALLLMARDSEAFPPYRPTPVQRWRHLVGGAASADGPSAKYQELLDLCDELMNRSGGPLRVTSRLEAQGLAWSVLNWPVEDLHIPASQRADFLGWRGDAATEVEVDRGQGPAPAMEAAAWQLLGSGLRGESTPMLPGDTAWTSAAAADLQERMSHDPGPSVGGFLDKLLVQLRDAQPVTRRLAAELVYLHCAPLVNLTPKRKITRVETLLATLSANSRLADELRYGLEADGAFNGGQGFNAQIARHIDWLCRFVQKWTDLEAAQRAEALRDPMAFAAVTAEVSQDAAISIEPSLNYLAWPGHHSPVVSSTHRRRIRDAFADEIGGATGDARLDVTRDLLALRHKHEAEAGHYPDWYLPPYSQVWKPASEASRRAWLVRPNPGHRPLVERWLDGGYVSLKAEHLGRVEPGADKSAVQVAIDAGYQHLDYAQRNTLAMECHAFLSRMREDDLVVTLAEGSLYVGVMMSAPHYRTDVTGRLQRAVAWTPRPIHLHSVPAPLPALLDQQGTVVDVTAALEQLEEYVGGEAEPEPAPAPTGAPTSVVPDLPVVTDDLAGAVHMPQVELQQVVDVLQDRQQVVLYGPPGTGKTYLARALARHIVGEDDASRGRLVQFHPSYSYEDFFEGYRPSLTEGGQATFRLLPGPLRQLAAEASQPENLDQPFVLIIDEMNRSNLAKVFGELYFLLEYRDESVRLQYSPELAFQLPRNLFIIATMNTADRSIAMVDAAIRRRFAFLEMHPAEEPVKGVLASYLADQDGAGERVLLLQALNAAIGAADRDLQVGPSYLMRPEAAKAGGLERIWRFDILPLLEEHYYGRLTRDEVHRRFGLAALRRGLQAGGPAQAETEADKQAMGEASGPHTEEAVGGDDAQPT